MRSGKRKNRKLTKRKITKTTKRGVYKRPFNEETYNAMLKMNAREDRRATKRDNHRIEEPRKSMLPIMRIAGDLCINPKVGEPGPYGSIHNDYANRCLEREVG